MPAIAADAECQRAAKEQGVCPSTRNRCERPEMKGFANELGEKRVEDRHSQSVGA